MTEQLPTDMAMAIVLMATLTHEVAENDLKDHPKSEWVITEDIASGLSDSGKRERLVLDLMDADKLNRQTAGELIYFGSEMEGGEDRAAVAALACLCYWAEGDVAVAKVWGMVGASENSTLATLCNTSLKGGLPFATVIPPIFDGVRNLVHEEHPTPVLSTISK